MKDNRYRPSPIHAAQVLEEASQTIKNLFSTPFPVRVCTSSITRQAIKLSNLQAPQSAEKQNIKINRRNAPRETIALLCARTPLSATLANSALLRNPGPRKKPKMHKTLATPDRETLEIDPHKMRAKV